MVSVKELWVEKQPIREPDNSWASLSEPNIIREALCAVVDK